MINNDKLDKKIKNISTGVDILVEMYRIQERQKEIKTEVERLSDEFDRNYNRLKELGDEIDRRIKT